MVSERELKFMEETMREILDNHKKWAEWLDELEAAYVRSQGKDDRYVDALRMIFCAGQDRGYPRVHSKPRIQCRYDAMRIDGIGHKLAEMLACQVAPCIMTDSVFLEGYCNGNQFEKTPHLGDYYASQAEKAGVDITGKVYMSGLAAFPGDPQAWVSSRGDVQRVCEERGYTADGAVTVKSAPRDVPPDVDVADDLVAAHMIDRLEADPSLAFKDRDEVFHETKESLKPHWA